MESTQDQNDLSLRHGVNTSLNSRWLEKATQVRLEFDKKTLLVETMSNKQGFSTSPSAGQGPGARHSDAEDYGMTWGQCPISTHLYP